MSTPIQRFVNNMANFGWEVVHTNKKGNVLKRATRPRWKYGWTASKSN